jgi:predicted protein tyrosine phosphatase
MKKDSKILFICTWNIVRSKCGEELLKNSGFEKVRSVGINASGSQLDEYARACTQEDLDWADIIFIFENDHLTWLLEHRDIKGKNLINLKIPDEYSTKNDPLLRLAISNKIAEYILRSLYA